MLQVYLPIAEVSVNLLVMLGLGAAVGFLSGMFGVGGGFLLTPLLMFSGVAAPIAVATGANQIVATSVSGAARPMAPRQYRPPHGQCADRWRRRSARWSASLLLRLLRQIGQAGLLISLTYVVFLGAIGALMLVESVRAIHKSRAGKPMPARRASAHNWIHGLPLKMRFPTSRLYISAIPPLLIGAVVGLLAAFLGAGGGFIMVPAMIYLLRMPTNIVIGTSMFQIIFVTAIVTLLHATFNHTLDVVLALILAAGGVMGGQFGVRAGLKLKGEQLRLLARAAGARGRGEAPSRPRAETRGRLQHRSPVRGLVMGSLRLAAILLALWLRRRGPKTLRRRKPSSPTSRRARSPSNRTSPGSRSSSSAASISATRRRPTKATTT